MISKKLFNIVKDTHFIHEAQHAIDKGGYGFALLKTDDNYLLVTGDPAFNSVDYLITEYQAQLVRKSIKSTN